MKRAEGPVTASRTVLSLGPKDHHGFLKNVLESLLFVADQPLKLRQLRRILEVDRRTVGELLLRLTQESQERGLRIVRLGETVQMVACPEAAPFVERLLGVAGPSPLSPAPLETLAIIAYRQPITRAQIETLRGVNSDRHVVSLRARGLVEEQGHAPGPGRPALLGTTLEFLQHFGLERLEDLPPLDGQASGFDHLSGESP